LAGRNKMSVGGIIRHTKIECKVDAAGKRRRDAEGDRDYSELLNGETKRRVLT
jgi:hypothetical protein